LVITFNASATTERVQTVMQGITYRFTGQSLGNLATAGITLNWVLNDKNTGSQGTGGEGSVTVAQTVNLTGVNDAPVLANTVLTAPAIDEDLGAPVGAVGFAVSSLATSGNISDVDTNAIRGLAIVATTASDGTWYYSTDNGTTWSSFTAAPATARLLSADSNNRLYLQPASNLNGVRTSALTVRAWDTIAGSNGGIANLSLSASRGGTNSFSTFADTVSLTINAVNDAPVASGSATLAAVAEDVGTSAPGATVSTLFSSNFSDATDSVSGGSSANTLAGVAIVDNTSTSGQGEWQYRVSSMATWDALPSVSAGGARLVASTGELRFVPAANFNGTPGGLTVRLVESPTSITHGATVDLSQASSYGSATAYSSATVALGPSVSAVNDAPAFSGLDATPTFTEDGTAVVLDSNATVSDAELSALAAGDGNWGGAVLTIARSAGANANDVFG
jgi:hypothetical protein